MSKQYLLVALLSLVLSVGAAFAVFTYFEEGKVKQTKPFFSQLESENARNTKKINQLILSVSELQESLHGLKEKSSMVMKEQPDSRLPDNGKLKNVTSQLLFMQQQMNELKQSMIALEKSSNLAVNQFATNVASVAVPNKEELIRQRQAIEKKERLLQQETISMYENLLNNGQKNIARENDLEDSVKNVIESNESYSDAQLQDVSCQGELCKVMLSSSESSIFIDDILSSFGEDVSSYFEQEEASGDITFYISRKGESLPRVNEIN